MKRKLFLALFLIFCMKGHAQIKFGLTAGAQLSNARIINFNTETRLSFNAGITTLTPVAEGIDFNLQLLVSGKGYKYYDFYGYNTLIRPLYLELPLTFRFNFDTNKDTKVFLGAGGYYAYGIGGNKIFYENFEQTTAKVNFGDDISDDLVASDLGLVFQLGVKFRENYEGQFFYDMGLKKIFPQTTSNAFNRVFGFNLGWYF